MTPRRRCWPFMTTPVRSSQAPSTRRRAAGSWPTPAPCRRPKDPHAPGLFPPGGCYLLKFKPSGNAPLLLGPRRQGMGTSPTGGSAGRLMVNFTRRPGRSGHRRTQLDHDERLRRLHDVVRHASRATSSSATGRPRSISSGASSTSRTLGGLFWRTNWG